jgi:hypothetical protein
MNKRLTTAIAALTFATAALNAAQAASDLEGYSAGRVEVQGDYG